MKVEVLKVPGCYNEPIKGVVLLSIEDDRFVNVSEEVGKLKNSLLNQLHSKFQTWMSGWATGQNMEFCHGYDKTQYGGKYEVCYQFELSSRRVYGFLCNPIEGNQRFLLFVGVHVLEKRKWRTEERVLRRITELAGVQEVIQAIKAFVYGFGRSIKGR